MTSFSEPDTLLAHACILPALTGKLATIKCEFPQITSAAQLQHKDFPEIQFVVPRYVAPGLTLLAAKPKMGKSWLCLDIAISVASGRYCLGDVKCSQGQV